MEIDKIQELIKGEWRVHIENHMNSPYKYVFNGADWEYYSGDIRTNQSGQFSIKEVNGTLFLIGLPEEEKEICAITPKYILWRGEIGFDVLIRKV